MSWEDIEQVPTKPKGARAAPCSLSLSAMAGGHVRLIMTLAPEVMEELGWHPEQAVSFAVGRGDNAGLVRFAAAEDGKRFRAVGKSPYRVVAFVPPDDMAAFEAPRQPDRYQVLHQRGIGNVLLVTLPWELTAEAPADDAQEAA